MKFVEPTVAQTPSLPRRHSCRRSPVALRCANPSALSQTSHPGNTRDGETIARDLAPRRGAPPLEEVRELLPARLDWMARMGLLDG